MQAFCKHQPLFSFGHLIDVVDEDANADADTDVYYHFNSCFRTYLLG